MIRYPPIKTRAIMSYLQVICEQHRLVEQHLDKFAAPATEGGIGGGTVTKEVGDSKPLCCLMVICNCGNCLKLSGNGCIVWGHS